MPRFSFGFLRDNHINSPDTELGNAGHAVFGVLVVLQLLDDGIFQHAIAHTMDESHFVVFGGNGTVEHLLEIVRLYLEHIVTRKAQDIVDQLADMQVDDCLTWCHTMLVDGRFFLHQVLGRCL